MTEALTPRDLALAIGVSESSLRRWVDSGRIRTYRTAGGHRRIPVDEGLRFIRESGSTVVRPELLGLAADAKKTPADDLYDALERGDADRAAGIVLSRYTAGESLAALCDGPIREAMHRIGELWTHGPRGILQEHWATKICGEILQQLRQLQPTADSDAPLSLGGAAEDDPYTLPSQMVSLVLGGLGFRTIDYGARTPADLLADAAKEQGASLVWLSLSVDLPKEQLRQQLHRLARQLRDTNTLLVLGGRHSSDINLGDASNVVMGSSMSHLADLAKGIMAGHRAASRRPAVVEPPPPPHEPG